MATKKFWFTAEAEDGENFHVYKKGGSIYVHSPCGKEYLCHPSVTSQEKVKREILLVFHSKIVSIVK